MSRGNILVAEDDANIRNGLLDALESEGYRPVGASDGSQALAVFGQQDFDLVLLDIMMPELSGYDVCRELRKRGATLPILMLTAKGEEIDKVVGLELGADDYITKPFGLRELLARVAAALRRSRRTPADPGARLPQDLDFGAARVNRKTFEARIGKQIHALTARELKLIDLFAAHPDEVLSRDDLLNRVWGIEYYGTTRTLDQHVAQLRKKIELDPANPQAILTVHGVGYRYRPRAASAKRPNS
jgi:DNA-binding response OmpR family regulator